MTTVLGLALPDNTGDGSGAKVGVTWRDFLNDQLGYTVSLEHYQYEYDLGPLVPGARKVEMEEMESALHVGLFYIF